MSLNEIAPCGGFIRLEGEHEILYKVPPELLGQKSVCVWVVAASKGSAIVYDVLSNPRAHFEQSEDRLFNLEDFTINQHSYMNM